jgi:hypothetical protein
MSQQTNNPTVRDTSSTVNTTITDSRKEDTFIREIYCCLTSCSQCTGTYIDSINGTMLRIICRHNCHSSGQFTNTEHDRDKQRQEHLSNNDKAIISRQGQRARNALLWSKVATGTRVQQLFLHQHMRKGGADVIR